MIVDPWPLCQYVFHSGNTFLKGRYFSVQPFNITIVVNIEYRTYRILWAKTIEIAQSTNSLLIQLIIQGMFDIQSLIISFLLECYLLKIINLPSQLSKMAAPINNTPAFSCVVKSMTSL